MTIQKTVLLISAIFFSVMTSRASAISFTADAVQIRGKQISHAKLFWQGDRVRFEYLIKGVPMVQIFDALKNKVTWLNTKDKFYLEKKLPTSEKMQLEIKTSKTYNPCKQFQQASCLHLKKTKVNGREADEWLITLTNHGRDYHVFQWIDQRYKTLLRQENPDGSALSVKITDNQVINGRKTRKLDMYAFSANGQRTHGIQWYDDALNVVVRQQYRNNIIDELRHIKVRKIKQTMFVIPKGYKPYSKSVQMVKQAE